MFDALKSFLVELTGEVRSSDAFAAEDYRVAAAALLVHVAHVDGAVDPAEQIRLRSLVEQRFGLDPARAHQLIMQASADEREAVDLYHFTSVLKRNLDETARQNVVEALWDMAYADGKLDELEESVVARVAELLGVSPRQRVEARQRAEQTGPETGAAAGPWGAAGPATS